MQLCQNLISCDPDIPWVVVFPDIPNNLVLFEIDPNKALTSGAKVFVLTEKGHQI